MHINKMLSFKTKRTGDHLPKTGRSSETRHLDQKTQDSLRVSSITDTHFKSAPDKLHEVVYLRHLVRSLGLVNALPIGLCMDDTTIVISMGL